MSRRRARELALSALFQWDVAGQDPKAAIASSVLDEDLPRNSQRFARELVDGALEHRETIDTEIAHYLRDWRLERLANVDRNVLRIALFEIRHLEDIPLSVTINEAVEIAKLYGGPDSGKFVNGILGRIGKSMPDSEPNSEVNDNRYRRPEDGSG